MRPGVYAGCFYVFVWVCLCVCVCVPARACRRCERHPGKTGEPGSVRPALRTARYGGGPRSRPIAEEVPARNERAAQT